MDSLEFALPSAWKGTVKVVFTGNHVKHVDIHRGTTPVGPYILEGRYSYCDNPTPVPHTIVKNVTAEDLPYRITPLHAARLCGKDNLGNTPLSIANLDFCNDTGTLKKARWTLPVGSGDTVQIAVEIIDNSGGGEDEVLVTSVPWGTRLKELFKRLFRRSTSS